MRLKLFLLVLLTFSITSVYSQVAIDSAYKLVQKDDSVALIKMVNKDNINLCVDGYPLLSQAIRYKAGKTFSLLLNKGADVNKVCDLKPVIFIAIKYGDLDVFKKLIAKGAKLDLKYGDYSLLDYAKKYNNQPIVDYLSGLK